MRDKVKQNTTESANPARERLAAKLRENLAKRKAQARMRSVAKPEPDPGNDDAVCNLGPDMADRG